MTGSEEEASFEDVPLLHEAWEEIEAVHDAGIMDGCRTNPLRFCPDDPVTREDMAIFLLRALVGDKYTPPPATGMFNDVQANNRAAPWIESLVRRGIASGCDSENYCPDAELTRGQMSVFLLQTLEGPANTSSWLLEPLGNVFDDIPSNHLFAAWIETLADRAGADIIGCSTPLNFCPQDGLTRRDMAVFIAHTFKLF